MGWEPAEGLQRRCFRLKRGRYRLAPPIVARPIERTGQPRSGSPEPDEAAWLRARRERRVRKTLGMVVLAALLVAVAIAIDKGSGGAPPRPGSKAARADVAAVGRLLDGLPESGVTLGSPRAPVTVTEFADLECPFCRAFAKGAERSLINGEVRNGSVKLVYRSLCTATCSGPLGHAGFAGQQAAAYAAGPQGRAWFYIELFYYEQGAEGTDYVSTRFLDGLARQIPGLNFAQWRSELSAPGLRAQVAADERAASAARIGTTPSLVIRGPGGRSRTIQGIPTYSSLLATIKSVR